jgi:hypothetical protein
MGLEAQEPCLWVGRGWAELPPVALEVGEAVEIARSQGAIPHMARATTTAQWRNPLLMTCFRWLLDIIPRWLLFLPQLLSARRTAYCPPFRAAPRAQAPRHRQIRGGRLPKPIKPWIGGLDGFCSVIETTRLTRKGGYSLSLVIAESLVVCRRRRWHRVPYCSP